MIKLSVVTLALVTLTAALWLQPMPMLGQNIGEQGRWRSDTGNAVYGYGAKTDTSTQSMAAAPGAGNAIYIYWAVCYSSSATVQRAIIKGGTTVLAYIPCPVSAGQAQPIRFVPPLKTAINVAFTMEGTASASTTYFMSFSRTGRYQP